MLKKNHTTKSKQSALLRFFATKGWLVACLIFIGISAFLRIYNIDTVPVSPYWEEVALGYDAYSIFMTGADHHGNPWPVVAFESFGDWKPSLYFYAILPFISFFDLSVLSVRLPAALSGAVIVGLVGWLAWKISSNIWQGSDTKDTSVYPQIGAVLGVVVATFSPWLIMFSRGGWEVNLGTMLLLTGFISGLYAIPSNLSKKSIKIIHPLWLLVSITALSLATYAYHGTRFMAPLIGLMLVFWWICQLIRAFGVQGTYKQLQRFVSSHFLWLAAIIVTASALLFPLISSLGSPQVEQRFFETTLFSSLEPVIKSNELRDLHGNTVISRVMYHRYWFHTMSFLENVSKHYSLDFLFLTGDNNPRHSVKFVGHMYLLNLLPLTIGAFTLFQKSSKYRYLIFGFLAIAVIPASISFAAPHALRTLPMAPILVLLIAIGYTRMVQLGYEQRLKNKNLKIVSLGALIAFFITVYLFFVAQFLHYYWMIYPDRQSHEWQDGYAEVVALISQYQMQYQESVTLMSREYGRPAMYYWFYTRTNPDLVQETSQNAAEWQKDQSELLYFDDMYFLNPNDNISEIPTLETKLNDINAIILAGSPEFVTATTDILQQSYNGLEMENSNTIHDARGEHVWTVRVVTRENL